MTREEEIKQAAENYAASVCKDCAARFYCKERIRKCYEYREQVTIYADAAMWADEHPKNVWHDTSEHPTEVGAILYSTTLGSFELVVHGTSGEDMWKVFVKDYGVVQWAYVNDLLPKTKEL